MRDNNFLKKMNFQDGIFSNIQMAHTLSAKGVGPVNSAAVVIEYLSRTGKI
jgi:hypothetical protein